MASGFERLVAKRRNKLPPGFQHYWNERRSMGGYQPGPNYSKTATDNSTNPLRGYGPPPTQAPFKSGQTRRRRQQSHPTFPTPGSRYRANRPRWN